MMGDELLSPSSPGSVGSPLARIQEAAPVRDQSLDWLRGILVLMVVLIHAKNLSGTSMEMPAGYIIGAVSSAVVPTFFAVSGYLAAHTLARPWARYMVSQFNRLLYPYVIWLVIGLLVSVEVFREFTWSAVTLRAVFLHPASITTSWYLYYAALFAVLAKMTRRLPRGTILGVAALGSLMILGLGHDLPAVAAHAIAFYLGLELRRCGFRRDHLSLFGQRGMIFGVAVALSMALAWPIVMGRAIDPTTWDVWMMLVIVTLLLVTSSAASEWFSNRFTLLWGRHSLELYVAHWPVMLVTMTLLREVGDPLGTAPLFILLVLVSLSVTWILVMVSRSGWASWLFQARIRTTRQDGLRPSAEIHGSGASA